VHAALVGGLEHRLRPLGVRLVVDADVSAERLGALELRIAGRGHDHARAAEPGDLHGGGRHAAPDADDEHVLARPDLALGHHHAPRRHVGEDEGRGLFSVGMPSRTNRSRWFSAHAFTRTRTSCGAIVGSGTSSYLSLSGPPNSWKRSAFIESR